MQGKNTEIVFIIEPVICITLINNTQIIQTFQVCIKAPDLGYFASEPKYYKTRT